MKLFLLSRTDNVGYDEYDAFLVRAKTEEEARQLANPKGSWSSWTTPENITCEIISNRGVAGVIIASFNAG